MPTSAFGNRYPQSTDAPNVPQYIQNAVSDVEGETVPRFATTTTRNTAYAARVSAGYAMEDGQMCTVAGTPYRYNLATSSWLPLPRAVTGALYSGTTSAGGDVLITHGLPVAPTVVQLTMYGTAGDAVYGKPVLGSSSSSVISVRIFDSRTGNALGSYNVNLMWTAFLL